MVKEVIKYYIILMYNYAFFCIMLYELCLRSCIIVYMALRITLSLHHAHKMLIGKIIKYDAESTLTIVLDGKILIFLKCFFMLFGYLLLSLIGGFLPKDLPSHCMTQVAQRKNSKWRTDKPAIFFRAPPAKTESLKQIQILFLWKSVHGCSWTGSKMVFQMQWALSTPQLLFSKKLKAHSSCWRCLDDSLFLFWRDARPQPW